MRRLPFNPRKHRSVAGKASSEAKAKADTLAALEIESCRAENDALRAQVADLLRSRDEDAKERRPETSGATLETKTTHDLSITTQSADDELRALRDENARLVLGARRDSETIARLADEIRTLTKLAAEVVIAARSCRPPAKKKGGPSNFVDRMGYAGSSVGSSGGSSGGVMVGTTVCTPRSIDERSTMGSSVGTTVGTTSGSSMRSSVGSSAGSSVRSSERSSEGSSTGSSLGTPGTSIGSSAVSSMGSVRHRVRNARPRGDFEAIEMPAEEARIVGGGNGGPPSFLPIPIRRIGPLAQNTRQGGGIVYSQGVMRQGRGVISLKSTSDSPYRW